MILREVGQGHELVGIIPCEFKNEARALLANVDSMIVRMIEHERAAADLGHHPMHASVSIKAQRSRHWNEVARLRWEIADAHARVLKLWP